MAPINFTSCLVFPFPSILHSLWCLDACVGDCCVDALRGFSGLCSFLRNKHISKHGGKKKKNYCIGIFCSHVERYEPSVLFLSLQNTEFMLHTWAQPSQRYSTTIPIIHFNLTSQCAISSSFFNFAFYIFHSPELI